MKQIVHDVHDTDGNWLHLVMDGNGANWRIESSILSGIIKILGTRRVEFDVGMYGISGPVLLEQDLLAIMKLQ